MVELFFKKPKYSSKFISFEEWKKRSGIFGSETDENGTLFLTRGNHDLKNSGLYWSSNQLVINITN